MDRINRYDELIMSYLDGLCTSEEALVLLSWLSECDENRVHFESLKRVWELTSFAMPETLDVEAALDVVNQKIEAVEAEKPEVKAAETVKLSWLGRNYKYVSGVAAAVVVALVLGILFVKPLGNEVILAQKDDRCVLPDGTSIVFDASSKLSYKKSFGKSGRRVSFEGVAHFDVAKDSDNPFVICCDNAEVEVLGTSFLLEASERGQVVDLYTGKVMMRSLDDSGNALASVEINPGERAILSKENGVLEHLSAFDVKKDELEKNHELVFNDERLQVIVETVAYIYNVNINLDERYNDRRLTVRFADDSINEVIETIASVADLRLTKSGSTYSLD